MPERVLLGEVEFAEPALLELNDAIEYYELQMTGLGKKFFHEVLETVDLIGQFPHLWANNSEHTRKAVLREFPYNLIYSLIDNKIYIIAVAHQNREPEYWIDRLSPMSM
jgi:plasmid stabilization system protein ParE